MTITDNFPTKAELVQSFKDQLRNRMRAVRRDQRAITKIVETIEKKLNELLNGFVYTLACEVHYFAADPIEYFSLIVRVENQPLTDKLIAKIRSQEGKLMVPFKMASVRSRQDSLGLIEVIAHNESSDEIEEIEVTPDQLALVFVFVEW
jgi:hypothetical protein